MSTARHALAAFLCAALAGAASAAERKPPVTNAVGMTFQFVPAGAFHRGGDHFRRGYAKHFNTNAGYAAGDEAPRHPVRLTRPFYLGETEVTVGQFKKFVEAKKYRTTAEVSGSGIDGFQPKPPANQEWRKPTFELRAEFNWRNPGFAQADDHPVVGVSWEDARAFCAWLSEQEKGVRYRLPTEAEWEYACRAGTQTWFSWSDEFSGVIHKHANIADADLDKAYPDRARRQWLFDPRRDTGDGHVFTAPVGKFPANAWGLSDMHGNVWEWCEDHYGDKAYEAFDRSQWNRPPKLAVDPKNDKPWNNHGQWRVIRGGAWCSGPVQCRSAVRSYYEARDAGCYLGFRVVREALAEDVESARKAFEREDDARRRVTAAADVFVSEDGDGVRVRIKPGADVGAILREVPEITEIEIDGATAVTAELLAQIAAVKNLRALVVWNVGGTITDRDFAALASKPLRRLLLGGGQSKLGDALLDHFVALEDLMHLDLNLTAITDAGLKKLTRLKKLESLRLLGTASTGEALAAFEGAPLKVLSVRLHDGHARHLRLFPELRELDILGAPVTANGFKHVEALTRLERLDVSGCAKLADAGFAPLAKLTRLRGFTATGSGAGDEACRHLGTLRSLTDLHLDSPALTDAGCEHLSVVSLRHLSIASTARVTDRGLVHLWRLDRLESLTVYASGVTGSGLDELTELKKLRVLTLSGMTDAGLQKVILLPYLEELAIGGARETAAALTDKGLLVLAQAPKLRNLNLSRTGTSVTDAGVTGLRQAAPRLTLQVRQ